MLPIVRKSIHFLNNESILVMQFHIWCKSQINLLPKKIGKEDRIFYYNFMRLHIWSIIIVGFKKKALLRRKKHSFETKRANTCKRQGASTQRRCKIQCMEKCRNDCISRGLRPTHAKEGNSMQFTFKFIQTNNWQIIYAWTLFYPKRPFIKYRTSI